MKTLNSKIISLYVYVSLFNCMHSLKRLYHATEYETYKGMFELSGAVAVKNRTSLLVCLKECADNSKCLTFFFNSDTTQCVMHSKHFHYEMPTLQGDGWKYYISRDATGRCPHPFLYYRKLDFCYIFEEIMTIDFEEIHLKCEQIGSLLAGIDTQEKDQYFKHIFSRRPHSRIPVGGLRTSMNQWTLPDGNILKYFNWYQGQPHNRINEVCLTVKTNDQLYDTPCTIPKPGVFLCTK